MRTLTCLSLSCALLLSAAPSWAEDRLEDPLFSDEELPAGEDGEGEEASDDDRPRRRMGDAVRDAAGEASASEEADDKAEGTAPLLPPTRYASAALSAGAGALAGALVGSGTAFFHAGLWTLSSADMTGLMATGFVLLPVLGGAGGALFGAYPFVDGVGMAVTAGAGAAGSGLGALLGFLIGGALAGPGGKDFPAESERTAFALTGTALGAGIGALLGAGTAAPFFAIAAPEHE